MRSRGWRDVSEDQEAVVAYRALLRTAGDLIARVCELEEEALTRERFVELTPLLHGWPRARLHEEMPQHCQDDLSREVAREAEARYREYVREQGHGCALAAIDDEISF